jgi:hypothetical protein
MAIRTLTPEEQTAKELKNKSALEYIKEGKTAEEARTIVQANKQQNN